MFAAATYLLFLALWGLNYRRTPLERKVAFDASRITREAAVRVGRQAVTLVNNGQELSAEGTLALTDDTSGSLDVSISGVNLTELGALREACDACTDARGRH